MQQVFDCGFPSGFELPIAGLNIGLEKLESLKGFALEAWEEEGLGPAHGGMFKLASGRLILIRELEHARHYLGERGPGIHADGGDIARMGVEALVAEALEALSLTTSALAWVQNAEARETASRLIRERQSRR